MRRLWPLPLLMFGLIFVCLGFAYDVMFAGIPYQDPTPGLQARYQFQAGVAAWILRLGLAALALGGVGVIVQAIARRFRASR